MTKSAKIASSAPSVDQIRSWWPNTRGEQIIEIMKTGLPYRRAVVRSRRYFMEGKYA
jgi:hypothetical protein